MVSSSFPSSSSYSSDDCDRVLVTGGAGLVGRAIQAFLLECGGEIVKTSDDDGDVDDDEKTMASAHTVVVVKRKQSYHLFPSSSSSSSSSSSVPSSLSREMSEWIFLSSKDVDLRSRDQTEAIFRDKWKGITHVIHLAAKVGGLFHNLSRKVEFYRENILINDNIMECSRIFKVKKLVSCLSTCIFPDKVVYPIDETMIHDGPPNPSNEGYAVAKRMVDVMSKCYKEEYGCNFICVVPTNVYGPHDNFSVNDGHVIPGLIHKCYVAKKELDSKNLGNGGSGGDGGGSGEVLNADMRGKFVIYGSGEPLRQFIFSKDLAQLFIWALQEYGEKEGEEYCPIILSVGEKDEVSIRDVGYMVADAFKIPDENVVFDASKNDGQYKKTATNKKLKSLLPDFKFTSIKDGIQETVKWLEENYEIARK